MHTDETPDAPTIDSESMLGIAHLENLLGFSRVADVSLHGFTPASLGELMAAGTLSELTRTQRSNDSGAYLVGKFTAGRVSFVLFSDDLPCAAEPVQL